MSRPPLNMTTSLDYFSCLEMSGSASSSDSWTPRRELQLPTELLHKIILWVISDSVHAICVSPEDTTWEKNVMNTFHAISPVFKAIANEVAIKAFDIPKSVRQDDDSLLATMRDIFLYLNRLGMRLRHPSEWGSVSFQTIDCSASSFVFAYALYLSCISLRRNASRSPRDVFESTHKVILSALTQSEALCDRVFPAEVTDVLRDSIQEEYDLARHGLVIVQAFNNLHDYATSMLVLQPTEEEDGSGPVTAVRSLIHGSLCRVEAVHEAYSSVLSKKAVRDEPRIYQLPGVLPALRKVYGLTFVEDEYDLQRRLQKIVDKWSDGCPFLNKNADVTRLPCEGCTHTH
ncbi:unnamed protein product [Cyclocybe aegerita]|uniref:Uncharacterized protein n=1 Tax=Cyclocybe aegerita TaxID=1973307 RepID=A0A8S0XRP8_CYCAE|nr:unnamed protein product [Cyclocybe aegerita]